MSDRPWIIMAIFPGHKPKEIGRTCYRSDAEAYIRFLKRHLTQGEFYVVFEGEELAER